MSIYIHQTTHLIHYYLFIRGSNNTFILFDFQPGGSNISVNKHDIRGSNPYPCRALVVGALSRGIHSGGGVTARSRGNPSQTLSIIKVGLHGIRPDFFHAEQIVVSLETLLQKLLNALRNSTLECLLAILCGLIYRLRVPVFSGWKICVV